MLPRQPALACAITPTARRGCRRDRGAPDSTYTVARELGHESEAMVRRVYAHLGEVRHRSDVVEYRAAQHLEQVGERLGRLGIVTKERYGRSGAS